MNIAAAVLAFHECYPNELKWISGKWFDKNDREIKNIDRFLVTFPDKKLFIWHKSPSDIQTWKEEFIMLYGDYDDLWCPLPIIEKAKEHEEVTMDDLPFPLDKKQLIIINRLLFHPTDEVMFITTGTGGSGKSTFLNIIRQLFDDDFSSASLSDLSNDFSVAEAVSHRIICSDELASGALSLPILKQLASKQQMFVNPKNERGYEVKTQSALFWCCNKAPRLDLTDSGILRRVVFYERDTKIKNPNPELAKKRFSEEELVIIARMALQCEDDNWFAAFIEETHEYLLKYNSVFIYVKERCNLQTRYASYDSYVDYCKNHGYKAHNDMNYSEILTLIEEWLPSTTIDDELPF